MKKINRKGFTLIELITVVLILGLIVAIAATSVSKTITSSKSKAMELTQKNLYSAATLYTTEFKTSQSDWYTEYVDDGTEVKKTGNEYSCTTIQMIVNKGGLPNNIVDPSTKEPINKNKFIKIVRDATTKTYAAELDSDPSDCGEYDSVEPSATFSVSKSPIVDNWYSNDFSVIITPSAGKSGVDTIEYYIKGNSQHKTQEGSGVVNFPITTDATEIQVCAIVSNRIGVIGKEVCSLKYNIDKIAPKIYNQASKIGSGIVTFNLTEANISKGVNYCVTKSEDSNNCSWKSTNASTVSETVTEGSGTYYIYAKDFLNNLSKATVNVTIQKTVTATCTKSSTGTSCATTKEISDLGSIVSVKSNQGNVSYSSSGTTVNLNFSGGTAKAGSGTSCNCVSSSYACNCSSYACNCSNTPCNCTTSNSPCNCTTSTSPCNCKTSNYSCNCTTSNYSCNCTSSKCNCKTTTSQCMCKTTTSSCCKHYTKVCTFGSCYNTCTQNGTCSSTSCRTCSSTTCGTCTSCQTCSKQTCKTCSKQTCQTCSSQSCQTCSSQSCQTCQSCSTCSSCSTCYSNTCDTCYTYEYTATITYTPVG